jgi:hypothetical protein
MRRIVSSRERTTIVTLQSANGFGTAHAVTGPRNPRVPIVRDELEPETGRIDDANRFLAKPRLEIRGRHAVLFQTAAPEPQRAGGHGERGRHHLAGALDAHVHATALVGERRPDRARQSALGAVVEVKDVVIVEVDRLLDETHAEQIQAEIQIGLRIVHGGRYMMKAENRVDHPSILRSVIPAAERILTWRCGQG